MAVVYDNPIQLDETLWRIRWTSNVTPPVPFRVYREGVLISSFTSPTQVGQIDLTASSGEFPYFEVIDLDGQLPVNAFPGHLTLHWTSTTGASYYRIEKFISAVWTLQATMTDNGAGAFTWLSDWLADETLHQFRIIPVDVAGNLGTSQPFSATMVRHPDTPNVAYTYNGAGTPTVTITAA